MSSPYRVLERKRSGAPLSEEEIGDLVRGATDGSWADAQLGAFLMAAAIRGLDPQETRALTGAMLASGEQWDLAAAVPGVGDKHSTGGVGDKISLILAPLLAAAGQPVAMLTGRGLGHTAGTADKLDAIAGLDQALDRDRAIRALEHCGIAIGMATGAIAPADRKLYALRDVTATVESVPLIVASILSKKLATGAAAIVFDVKTGAGAFMREPAEARALALRLVETSTALGRPARALITDMGQPLGRWVGHAAEVRESLSCLAGEGPADLVELAIELAAELGAALGRPLERAELRRLLGSGRALAAFEHWAAFQGASPGWQEHPLLELAPLAVPLCAAREGVLARVATKEIGLLLAEVGGGRQRPGDAIDHGVSLEVKARIGERVARGDELARLYLRRPAEAIAARLAACFELAEEAAPSGPLVLERL